VPDLTELTQRLGVEIDPELLVLALTHRSYAYEHPGTRHNERLEFLGDSILGQAVTVMLYRRFPELDEGDLAKRRASLVSTLALADIARGIGLGEFLRLGKGEERTGGADKSSILADTLEAVLGACFIANGPEPARDLVLRLVETLMDDPDRFGLAMDPKTALQELVVARGLGEVAYRIEARGPDHARVFTAVAVVGDAELGTGEGSSKKAAESVAAFEAVETLRAASRAGASPAPSRAE